MLTVASSEGNAIDGFCSADEYFDGVIDQCVPCKVVCRLDLPLEFCKINCREFYDLVVGAGDIKTATTPRQYQDENFPQNTDDVRDLHELTLISSTMVLMVTALATIVVFIVFICVMIVCYKKPWNSLEFSKGGFTSCKKKSADDYADDKQLIDKKNVFSF
jgi:hypothetical protein